jgi:hypothetical protein
MEMVNQMALCVSIKTLKSNNGVCARKNTMKTITPDAKKKNQPEYSEVSTLY